MWSDRYTVERNAGLMLTTWVHKSGAPGRPYDWISYGLPDFWSRQDGTSCQPSVAWNFDISPRFSANLRTPPLPFFFVFGR
jgi:hypothetical protein